MARTVTLAELRTQARQRSDMVGSNFVSDSELNGYINASIAELYDLLLTNYGEDYYTNSTPTTISVVAGTDTYDLAESTYKIAGVDVLVGSRWVTVGRYPFGKRNRAQEISRIRDVKYKLIGTKLRFTPNPTSNHTVRVWEIPAPVRLENDEDTFDGIAGWEEYVVVDAAIKMLAKEESDTSDLLRAKQIQVERIERASANRDIGEPDEITDLYTEDFDDTNYIYGSW